MKRPRSAYFFILLVILVLGACKKRPFDYRNKYQGVWRFTYSYYKWSAYKGEAELFTDRYRGRIYYDGLASKRDEMHIEFSDEFTSAISLTRSGHFSGCGGRGKFKDKKNVEFSYSSNGCSTTYSSGISYTITGTKDYSE